MQSSGVGIKHNLQPYG